MFSRKSSMESSEKKAVKEKFSLKQPKQTKRILPKKIRYQCFLDEKTGEITENFNLFEKLSKKHEIKL